MEAEDTRDGKSDGGPSCCALSVTVLSATLSIRHLRRSLALGKGPLRT